MSKKMTFDDLMDCYHLGKDISNRNVYEDLKKEIHNRVVPVIGAGLSCWAGYPLWSQLLNDIANDLADDPATQSIAEEIKSHVKNQQFEKAGSAVEHLYKSVQFQRKMKEVFSEKHLDGKNRPPYQSKITELFPGPIVTTNYDVSLERLLNLTYCVTPEDNYQKEAALETIHAFERILIKLHGSVNIPRSMILTEEKYNKAYGKNPKKPDMRHSLPSTLQEAFHVGSPFFLGCGLGPDRTCAVLKACIGVKGFALLELPKETENKKDPFHPILSDKNGILPALDNRRIQMNDLKLQVIWYPYGRHEAVGILLEKLANDKNPPAPPADKFRPTATTVQQSTVYEAFPLYQPRKVQTDKIVQKINNPRVPIILVHGVAGIGKTEICKAAYRQIKASEPDFYMPYIDLTGCETVRSVLEKIADVYGIVIPDISSPSSGSHPAISLPDITPREVLPHLCRQISDRFGTKKQIAFLDNYEEVWFALAPKEQEALFQQLAELAKAGLRFLISSQIKINVNCTINIPSLDNDTIKKINSMTWNDFMNLDSVRLFCKALGKTPSVKEEKEALKALIAEINGHPLSLVLAAYSGKKCASLVDLMNNWHHAKGHILGDRTTHNSLHKSLSLTWNCLKENREAILHWALHSLSLYPMDPIVLSELRTELPEPVSEINWSRSDQQLRQFGLVEITADKEEEMHLAIKKALPYFDKEAINKALTAWVTWCNKLILDGDDDQDRNYVSKHKRAIKYFPQYLYLADYCLDNQRYDELRILLDNLDNYYYTDAQSSVALLKRVLTVSSIEPSEKCSLAWFICDLLLFMGRISPARAACKKAEKLCRDNKEHYILAYVLQTKGKLLEYEGQIKDALASYSDAEKLFRQEEESGRGQASTLVNKGLLLQRIGRIGEARAAYRYAEKVYLVLKDRLGLAYVKLAKSALAQLSCHIKLARNTFDEAEKLFLEENDERGRADLLVAKGALLYSIGRVQEAMSAYDESEQYFIRDNNQNSLANILQNRGNILRMIGRHEDAKKSFDKAENMFKETQDKLGRANVLLSKAEWLKDFAQYSQAMDVLGRAYRIYQKEMDNIGQTETLLHMGEIKVIKKDYENAEDVFSQVERLCHEGQNKLAMINLWKLRGDMYVQIGSTDKAEIEYSKAEEICRKNQIIPDRAELMLSKGGMYLIQEEYGTAFDCLKKALHLFQRIRNISGQCASLLKLEFCAKKAGNTEMAYDYHRQAVALMQSMPAGVKKRIRKTLP